MAAPQPGRTPLPRRPVPSPRVTGGPEVAAWAPAFQKLSGRRDAARSMCSAVVNKAGGAQSPRGGVPFFWSGLGTLLQGGDPGRGPEGESRVTGPPCLSDWKATVGLWSSIDSRPSLAFELRWSQGGHGEGTCWQRPFQGASGEGAWCSGPSSQQRPFPW